AIEPHDVRAQPGDVLNITLYWRALDTTDTGWQVYLHTAESDIVRRDSLPATGMLLATDWQPGDTWVERYVIRIPETDPQTTHTLIAGLYDPQTDTTMPATNAGGEQVTPVVGRLAIRGEARALEAAYCFADSISLAEPSVTREGDTLTVCLEWGARETPPEPYQIFVHVLPEEGGDPLAQVDTAPLGGRYPTDVWQPGEAIAACIPVDIAQVAGDDWHIGLGLYRLPDGQRPEASACGDDAALTVQHNMVIVPAPAGQ
ncbi:MAG: hypothetical protein JXN59_06230, partial [Anaerolineae bacterium]|nr:hypothetical protein [Anaerolineae bacterium]